MSRQAVHHTVHRLIEAGVVELIAAGASRRDKLVRITPAGRKVQVMAATNLRQIESEVAMHIGDANLARMRRCF